MHRDGYDYWTLGIAAGAAAGTVGTLVWTIILFIGERSRREKGEKQERDTARRAQANLITAWIETDPGLSPGNRRVRMHNGSEQPAFDAQLCVIDADGEVRKQTVGLIPPGPTTAGALAFSNVIIQGTAIPQAFWFDDAAGQHWFRDWDGQLHEYPTQGTPDWYTLILDKAKPRFMPR